MQREILGVSATLASYEEQREMLDCNPMESVTTSTAVVKSFVCSIIFRLYNTSNLVFKIIFKIRGSNMKV